MQNTPQPPAAPKDSTGLEAVVTPFQAALDQLFAAADRRIAVWFPYYGETPWLQVLFWIVIAVAGATLVAWFLRRIAMVWLTRTRTSLDDQILEAITTPIYLTMIAGGLRIAIERLTIAPIWSGRFGLVLSSVVIVLWTIAGFKVIALVVGVLAARDRPSALIRPTNAPLFDNLFKVAVFLFATYLLISVWGGNLSALLTAGGIAGLAVGFAAKDTLANLFAGVFIMADGPFKIGDYINLDSGERGKVTHIGIRSTRILTRDDVEVTVPNSVLGNAKIVNESGGPYLKYRVRIPFGVAYGTDVDRVSEVLLEVAASDRMVCSEPEARVRMRAFGESSLDFELLCWIEDPELRGLATHGLLVAVYKKLAVSGIQIPFPQRDLHIKELPPAAANPPGDKPPEDDTPADSEPQQ